MLMIHAQNEAKMLPKNDTLISSEISYLDSLTDYRELLPHRRQSADGFGDLVMLDDQTIGIHTWFKRVLNLVLRRLRSASICRPPL